MNTEEKKENILVVDDTPANLQILLRLFRDAGYRVRAVPDGEKALKAVESEVPDIILLDINMPGMDGYEVCRQLKNREQFRSIPIIFISALSETFDKVKAFESGGVDYITKPIQIEEARARVKTHLALHRYQSQIEEKNQQLNKAMKELKEAQSQLVQTEKMASLGVLTAGVAHELNNPITYIYTSTLGLKSNVDFFISLQEKFNELTTQYNKENLENFRQYMNDHDYQERLEEFHSLVANIITGAKRTSEIVKSLRLFTRLDEDDKKIIDLHESIDSTLLLLYNKYKDFIEVEKAYANIPPVSCYPAKINQVFMNILSNAIEAIELKDQKRKRELIHVQTGSVIENQNDYASVKIADTGIGIPENILDKIFDPFFTTKEIGKGVGLGLSICKSIVEEHNGKIMVDRKKNGGTCFNILLPLNTD